MDTLYTVLLRFLPILALILLGVLIRRIKLLKPEAIEGFKTVILNISLPVLLFMTFARTAFEPRYILIFIAVFLVCLLTLLLGKGLSGRLRPGNRYYPGLFSGYETGMLGYALFTAIFGSENTYKIAIFDVGQVLFVFFVLMSFLRKQNGTQASTGAVVLGFFKTPVVLAILAGILFSCTGLTALVGGFRLTGAFESALNLIGNLTQPLICIVIGYELTLNVRKLAGPLLTVLLRLAVMLAAAFVLNELLVVRLLGLDRSFCVALYTLFLLPPPFIIPIVIGPGAEKEKSDVLSVLSVHIVLTLAAFLVLVSVTA